MIIIGLLKKNLNKLINQFEAKMIKLSFRDNLTLINPPNEVKDLLGDIKVYSMSAVEWDKLRWAGNSKSYADDNAIIIKEGSNQPISWWIHEINHVLHKDVKDRPETDKKHYPANKGEIYPFGKQIQYMIGKGYNDEQIINELLEDYGDKISERDYKINRWKQMIKYLRRHKFASRITLSTRDEDKEPSKEELEKQFNDRTNYHIKLVQKYIKQIQYMNLPEVDNKILDDEGKKHDAIKWEKEEYEPYLYIAWRYKQKDEGKKYELPEGMEEKTHAATFHHITNSKHHPDYWDENITSDALNSKDRDKPTGNIVDATKMPPTYIASMMADWAAMSEEKDSSLDKWIKDNVNIRWKFDKKQVDLINKIKDKLEIK